jgi:hypothetical protein
MSRLAVPLAALLALALPASAAAQAVAPSLEVLSQPIVVERDPAAAKAFLGRDDHGALRPADEALFDRTFRAANELTDLTEAFATYKEASGLREALGAREGYELLASPGALEAWARRHAPGVDPALVRAASYDWDALEPALRAEMGRRGFKPERWAKLPFAERHQAASKAGAEAVAALKSRMPRSQAELDALAARAQALTPWLGVEAAAEAEEAVEKARAAWEGLKDADTRARASGDPMLAAAVAAARASKDPAAALERLAKIFDGLGVRHPSVADVGPGKPSQRLGRKASAQLAEMVRSGVLREMRGTVVGDEVARVFDAHGMNLVLKPLAPGTQGEFEASTREISLNTREIEKWLRSEDLTAAALLKGGPHLRDLVLAVTPVVLHEGIHLQQDVWQKAGKLPDIAAQSQEVEANAREAAFILEKAARDKGYRTFLEKNQARFGFVGSAVTQSAALARDPAAFRASIMADSYPSNPSVEADSAAAAGGGDAARRADAARVYRAYRARDRLMWEQVTRVLGWVRANPQGEPAGPPAPGRAR